jgi:uncharacterized protein
VFEPRYLSLVEWALGHGRLIGLVQPRGPSLSPIASAPSGAADSVADDAPLHAIGCLGRITGFEEAEGGKLQVTVKGLIRFRVLEELPLYHGFRRARVDYEPYRQDLVSDGETPIDRDRLMRALKAFLKRRGISANWEALTGLPGEALVSLVAMLTPFEPSEKQALLEAPGLPERSKLLVGLLEMGLLGDTAQTVRH